MDVSRVLRYTTQIKQLLQSALKPDFAVNLNLLLPYFINNENSEITGTLQGLEDFFGEWIVEACNYWEQNEDVHTSTDLSCFIFELTSLMSRNERHFMQLSIANVYLRLCDTFRVRKCFCAPHIKLVYIKLLETFLNHKKGVEWIRATNSWIDILNYILGTNSIDEVVKMSYNFIYKLLESKDCYDETFCKIVVKRIIQPLMVTKNDKTIHELKNKLTSTLQLIIAILEQYLKNEWHLQQHKHIPRIFFEDFKLLEIVENSSLTDDNLICNFMNINCLIYFIDLSINSKNYMITEFESMIVFEKTFLLMEKLINTKRCFAVLNISYLTIKYWSLIHTRLQPITHQQDINKNPITFQNQIIPLQAIAVLEFLHEYFKLDWNVVEDLDELRHLHMQDCFGKLSEHMIRLVYSYIKVIVSSIPYKYDITIRSINYIIESSKYYSQETAITLFQTLLYVLHDTIAIVKENEKQLELVKAVPDFYQIVIRSLESLIETHDIRWGKCVESICVVNSVLDFLMLTTWPTNLTIEALKLLKLSIERYMSPNLTLLVDRTSDSSLKHLGPVLLTTLHDKNWEICNCSLQVLTTMSELSHSKFLSFQNLLQQENFPSLVLKLCERGSESVIRVSALKCIQEMVQSDVLWNQFLKNQQLLKRATNLLNSETEGSIRVEAVTLIYLLYIKQRFKEEEIIEVYQLMAATATIDLHWEVKKKSLEFWDKIIWEWLKDQGMIDGNFPEVTFSREQKKIITLNKEEIQKRLNKVLNELNKNGCLQVLIKVIQEDPDIEVVQTAIEVTSTFAQILRKYNIITTRNQEVVNKDFLGLVYQDLNKILEQRKQWLKNTTSLDVLLDDMLKGLNS